MEINVFTNCIRICKEYAAYSKTMYLYILFYPCKGSCNQMGYIQTCWSSWLKPLRALTGSSYWERFLKTGKEKHSTHPNVIYKVSHHILNSSVPISEGISGTTKWVIKVLTLKEAPVSFKELKVLSLMEVWA